LEEKNKNTPSGTKNADKQLSQLQLPGSLIIKMVVVHFKMLVIVLF
jgi:hypothetical protein